MKREEGENGIGTAISANGDGFFIQTKMVQDGEERVLLGYDN